MEEVYDRFEITLSFPTSRNNYCNESAANGTPSSSNYLSNDNSNLETDDNIRFYDEWKRECDQSSYDGWDSIEHDNTSECSNESVSLKRNHDDDSDSGVERKHKCSRNNDSDTGKSNFLLVEPDDVIKIHFFFLQIQITQNPQN